MKELRALEAPALLAVSPGSAANDTLWHTIKQHWLYYPLPRRIM